MYFLPRIVIKTHWYIFFHHLCLSLFFSSCTQSIIASPNGINSVTSPGEQLSCWTGHWQERASLKLCQFPRGQVVWNEVFLMMLMEEYLQAPWGWLQRHAPWTSGPQHCDNSFWSPGGWHLSTSEGYLGPQLQQTATAHLQDVEMRDAGHLEIRSIRIFNLLI